MRAIAAAALLAAAGTVRAQAVFQGMGDLPEGAFYSEGYGVSADGSAAVGGSITGGSGFSQTFSAFRFTRGGGIEFAIDIFGNSSKAFGVSADGTVVIGVADFGYFSPLGVQAFLYSTATGGMLLGDLPGGVNGVPHSAAYGVSRDGSVVIGNAQSDRGDEAFRYDVATQQMAPLGSLSQTTFGAYAKSIAGDGSVIVGLSYSAPGEYQAYRWTQGGGMVGLGFLPTAAGVVRFSEADAVSANGAVIVGQSRSMNSPNGGEAFRWTQATGLQGLGDLPGGAFQSWAYGVSADGSVIVGRATIEGPSGPFGGGSMGRAFIWDAQNGMRDLQVLLVSLGADLTGWSLTEARAISADGRTVVGTGTDPQGATEAWVAYLPAPACYANCDGNSTPPILNINDFVCFQSRFVAGDTWANCDGSTTEPILNVADFVCFINRYAAGCE